MTTSKTIAGLIGPTLVAIPPRLRYDRSGSKPEKLNASTPPDIDKFPKRMNRGNPAFRCQFNERHMIGKVLSFIGHHERIDSLLLQRREDALVRRLINGVRYSAPANEMPA